MVPNTFEEKVLNVQRKKHIPQTLPSFSGDLELTTTDPSLILCPATGLKAPPQSGRQQGVFLSVIPVLKRGGGFQCF